MNEDDLKTAAAILSNFRRIQTKQYRTVLFLENYVVRTPVPNTVLFEIFNMFDQTHKTLYF
jgi:hypothetical protein